MLRFVLLRHECPASFNKPSHWDFMLEWGDSLRTWDLRKLPARWANLLEVSSAAEAVEAIALPTHRIKYLNYEGPVSGDRGSVRCCDRGTYEILHDSSELLEICLCGELLAGKVRLQLTGSNWQMMEIAG